jgi:LysR family transcriptional regulator, chromosome initiation inhibitor
VDLDLAQLRALAAVVAEGTFEAAARVLHVTPSAVSQRIRALESAAGRVLVVRTKPVRPTEAGRTVLRLAREVELLAADAARELDAPTGMPVLPVAVNADSLATWFLAALAPLAQEFCFDLRREDQEHTAALLRDGSVVAAVTSQAEPVAGCSSLRLGAMHYQPCASRDFARRWFPGGVDRPALERAPVVVFDRDDDLQDRWLERFGSPDPPRHHVPATSDFGEAVGLGFGWGMLLPAQIDAIGAEVFDLDPGGGIDVPLFWQRWKIRSSSLDRLTAAVQRAWG